MDATVADIITLMALIAPPGLAENWDNSGLQLGKRDWPVRTVLTALDPSPEVIVEAIRLQADMLITHHPFLFAPLKCVDLDTPIGELISLALSKRLTIFAAHTNFDSSAEGLNDILAHRLSLQDILPLQSIPPASNSSEKIVDLKPVGLGRVGRLLEKVTLRSFARDVKARLSLDHLLMVGNPDLVVESVAICTGSGSSLLNNFYSSGAQVYISGDLRYHDARTAEINHVGLIDIGHFASEHLMVTALQTVLQNMCDTRGISVTVHPCLIEKNPFVLL